MFSDEREEKVFESTRIISEDEVPPDIREKIRQLEASHANTVTKVVGTVDAQNVGALMSALRPNVIEQPEVKLSERGTTLAAKLANIAGAGEEKRDERIRSKAKFLVDNVKRNLKRDADEISGKSEVQVENVSV